MKLADWPLQQALVTRLAGIGAPVFDEVPQEAGPPYIKLGDTTGNNNSTKVESGTDNTIALYVYSKKPGMKEVKLLMSAIVEALTNSQTPLNLGDEWEQVKPVLEYFEALHDPDGKVRHGVLRFRCKIAEVV